MYTHISTVPRLPLRWLAAIIVVLAAISLETAYAEFGTQLEPFYFSNGTEVVSVNGEPCDAVLNRFFDNPRERIVVQFMTQHLNPGEEYDIWLEGTNDGTDSFSWWAGRSKATAAGKLNASKPVYVGAPQGPAVGSFENPRAIANVVIKTTGGLTVQTAYFPAF